MLQLIELCWKITLMRIAPYQMPDSKGLLVILMLVTFLIALLGLVMSEALDFINIVFLSAYSVAAPLSVLAVILSFKGLSSRWRQSAISMLSIDLVLGVVTMPLLFLSQFGDGGAAFGALLLLVATGWMVVAKGAIYRHSMEVTPGLGLALALTAMLLVAYGQLQLWPELIPDLSATASSEAGANVGSDATNTPVFEP